MEKQNNIYFFILFLNNIQYNLIVCKVNFMVKFDVIAKDIIKTQRGKNSFSRQQQFQAKHITHSFIRHFHQVSFLTGYCFLGTFLNPASNLYLQVLQIFLHQSNFMFPHFFQFCFLCPLSLKTCFFGLFSLYYIRSGFLILPNLAI